MLKATLNTSFMKKIILLFLLILSFIVVGCKDENVPEQSDDPIPEPPIVDFIPERTIPVVFHVLYEDASDPIQSPSEELFKQRIDQLNRFYAATLFTLSDIPGVPSRDVDIKFTLANRDPEGNLLTEPGNHRVKYSKSSNMSAESFLYSSSSTIENKPIFWNPNRYVNIWLFSFLNAPGSEKDESGVTGISFLPYCTTTHPLVKLSGSNKEEPGENYYTTLPDYMHVMALSNMYFTPTAYIDPFDQKSLLDDEGLFTLCHEMGHYLGLLHAFYEPREGEESLGCVNPDNASDDGCSDTPKYNRMSYMELVDMFLNGAPLEELPYNLLKREPCDGSELYISTNVMDYYYGFRTEITLEQKKRIDHVINYSPLMPRNEIKTRALFKDSDSKFTGKLPKPVLMKCYNTKVVYH